jgi:hypothetical protein
MTAFRVFYSGGIGPMAGFAASAPVEYILLAVGVALLGCVLLLWKERDLRKHQVHRGRRRIESPVALRGLRVASGGESGAEIDRGELGAAETRSRPARFSRSDAARTPPAAPFT